MRLIDADALMKEYAEFVKESNNSDFADVPTWNDAVSLLGSAPTVKAIPIDWIMWDWRRNQPYDTQEDEWMRLGVLKMLRDWAKENEKDI